MVMPGVERMEAVPPAWDAPPPSTPIYPATAASVATVRKGECELYTRCMPWPMRMPAGWALMYSMAKVSMTSGSSPVISEVYSSVYFDTSSTK